MKEMAGSTVRSVKIPKAAAPGSMIGGKKKILATIKIASRVFFQL
jgi:hypothetical protein